MPDYYPGDRYTVAETLPPGAPAARAVASVFSPGDEVTVREVDDSGAPVMEREGGPAMRVPAECEPYFELA